MDFKCCPVCGNGHISNNLCKDCGFDCSTNAEQYETLMIIERWKSPHSYTKKEWTNSWDFWKNIKIARSTIQMITFQKGIAGCSEDADELIDCEGHPFRIWSVGNHMYIGADNPIVFPADISFLFAILKNLNSIEFDNINTSKVTDMRYLFAGCSKLTELDLSCFDTSHVTNMSDMFYGCGRLETLNNSSFDITNVTDMSNMFYGGAALVKVDLSVLSAANANKSDMFYNCAINGSKPSKPFISYMRDTNSVSSEEYWGVDIAQIKAVTFLDSLKNAPYKAQDISDAEDRSVLSWVVQKELFVASSGMIGFPPDSSLMFSGMYNLKSINFNHCINTSSVRDMHSMFYSCKKLSGIDLSDFDTVHVKNMSYMFAFCDSLTTIDLTDIVTDSATDMRYMFCNCSSLQNLSLKNCRTPNVTNMSGMFAGCSNLQQLDMPDISADCVKDMFSIFSGCHKLQRPKCIDPQIITAYIHKI